MKRFIFLSFLLFCGCESKDSQKELGQPSDYFPMKVGMAWTYRIELGEAEPLQYNEVRWPQGDSVIVIANRGRFMGMFAEGKPKSFELKLRVSKTAPKQGELEYDGVELEVLKDELGVFEHASHVYLAATRGNRFMGHLVVTYPPETPGAPSGAWGTWNAGDGTSMRIMFFGDKPGLQIGIGNNPTDKILFNGGDPDTEGNVALYFTRMVSRSEKKDSILSAGFTEDTWFAKNGGLIKLVQKINGKISMTWKLVDFSN